MTSISWLCFIGTIIILPQSRAGILRKPDQKTINWDFNHGIDLPTQRPLNIAHRGCSGALPEHTKEAYQLAIDEGADIIECDVTITKDLVLICLHESWMDDITNVAEVFPNRSNTYFVPEQAGYVTDYFSVDFTLAEIKMIRKKQRFSFRNPNYDYQLEIATFDEYVTIAKGAGRPVGIAPEIKDPRFMNSLSIIQDAQTTFEDIIINALHGYGYNTSTSPCFVQCFEENSLAYVSNRTELPLIQLTGYPLTDELLQRIAEYAYGIGPEKSQLVQVGFNNTIVGRSDLVDRSHSFGLRVHPYTARNEYQYLAWDYEQDPWKEYQEFFQLGIDGIFTDFPGTYNKFLFSIYANHSNCSESLNSALYALETNQAPPSFNSSSMLMMVMSFLASLVMFDAVQF